MTPPPGPAVAALSCQRDRLPGETASVLSGCGFY